LVVLFALSLSLNVWLGLLLRTNRIPFSPMSLFARSEAGVIGSHPLLSHLRDLSGHPFSISPIHNRLIYIFSPTCRWCEKNVAGIQDLAKKVSPEYDVVGLVQSPDGMTEYLARHSLSFPIVVDNDPADMAALGFQGTPQTILIVDGKIVHNWSGAFQGKVRESIQGTLGVSINDAVKDMQ